MIDPDGVFAGYRTGTYVYDGDGNRVKKTVSGTTTLYWPGTSGTLDESNSSASTMGPQVRFNNMLVWREDSSGSNGLFLFQDHLGSTRITDTAAGSSTPVDDIDYRPFGMVSNNYGLGPSDNHYLFNGYESDSETTSDYAVSRNLGMTLGRFNRPDPSDASYDTTNPQSLNRYGFVVNRPLSLVDPTGLIMAEPYSLYCADAILWGDPESESCGSGCEDEGECLLLAPAGGGGGASDNSAAGPAAAEDAFSCSYTGHPLFFPSRCSYHCVPSDGSWGLGWISPTTAQIAASKAPGCTGVTSCPAALDIQGQYAKYTITRCYAKTQ